MLNETCLVLVTTPRMRLKKKRSEDSLCVSCGKSYVRSSMYASEFSVHSRNVGQLLSNSGVDHWKAAINIIWNLQRIKDYILTYQKLDQLEIIGYSNSDFGGCQDNKRSTSGYVFC